DLVIFGSDDGSIYAVDKQGGERVWSFQADEMVFTSPLVHKGLVYFGSGNTAYGVALSNGSLLWSRELDDVIYSSPAALGDRLFFASYGRKLYAFKLES
ncbi:MAG: PQQ-binding-like beta-propeller repeat protein, partial [Candidatus Hydrothermarchaeales archaeon]